MPNDIDRSLLERLQALRGVGSPPAVTPERAAAPIGKAKTTTCSQEDPLTARLKSLRLQYEEPSSSSTASKSSPKASQDTIHRGNSSSESESSNTVNRHEKPGGLSQEHEDVDLDAMLQTDISTLEEMLAHIGAEDNVPDEPSDTQIRALLDEISQSLPPDIGPGDRPSDDARDEEAIEGRSDDEEYIEREADQVIARFRDEMELEATRGEDGKDDYEHEDHNADDDEDGIEEHGKAGLDQLALPSLPTNLDELPSTTPTTTLTNSTTTPGATSSDIDDITARMAILKASGRPPRSSIDLPSVPDAKPSSSTTTSGKAANRLTSKTNYTDDDMDTWCTVCLEDGTLQCPACDDDVYCTRCWREMHVGPAAAFDDKSHKAVIFRKTKKKEKKVAVGAS